MSKLRRVRIEEQLHQRVTLRYANMTSGPVKHLTNLYLRVTGNNRRANIIAASISAALAPTASNPPSFTRYFTTTKATESKAQERRENIRGVGARLRPWWTRPWHPSHHAESHCRCCQTASSVCIAADFMQWHDFVRRIRCQTDVVRVGVCTRRRDSVSMTQVNRPYSARMGALRPIKSRSWSQRPRHPPAKYGVSAD